MKTDIHKYRQSLVDKLATVDAIIAEMGGTTNTIRLASKNGRRKSGRRPRRKLSAAAKAAISKAAKARWAKAKASGKNRL